MRRRALIASLAGAGMLLAANSALAALADQFNSQYYTIVNAAAANNVADVRVFITRGVNADAADPQGRTALSYAAQLGNAEMAQMLIDARASPDLRDKMGGTPLHWAAENGKLEVVKVLLAGSATVDLANRQGITPLMLAVSHGNLPVVKALLAAGADPRKADFTGRDSFGYAAGKPAIQQALQSAPKS
jgi:ankyrin repeat protein